MTSDRRVLMPGLDHARGPLLALLSAIDPVAIEGADRLDRMLERRRRRGLTIPLSPDRQRLLMEILVEHLVSILDGTEPIRTSSPAWASSK